MATVHGENGICQKTHHCNYYLVLSFLFMYSSSGLSTDVFPNKTNINTTPVTIRNSDPSSRYLPHCSFVLVRRRSMFFTLLYTGATEMSFETVHPSRPYSCF